MKLSTRLRRAKRIADAMPIAADLRQHTGDVDTSWMTRRVDYKSSEVADLWLTTPFSRNGRGDEPLAESNYRIIYADLEKVAGFDIDYRIDAWPGGTIHTIQVRADDALALRAVDQWIAALSDYPIADDSDYSEEEWSQNHPTSIVDGEILECYAEGDDCSCGVTPESDDD